MLVAGWNLFAEPVLGGAETRVTRSADELATVNGVVLEVPEFGTVKRLGPEAGAGAAG